MSLFKKDKTSAIAPEAKYQNARFQIMAAIVLTVINIAFIFFNSGSTYFLFSINGPYTLIYASCYFCGMLPDEAYSDIIGTEYEFPFLPASLFAVALVIALIIIGVYVLCFVFSKKRVGWMICALVLLSIDTAYLLLMALTSGSFASSVLDILFHAWLVFYAVSGVKSFYAIKKAPLVDEAPVCYPAPADEIPESVDDNDP